MELFQAAAVHPINESWLSNHVKEQKRCTYSNLLSESRGKPEAEGFTDPSSLISHLS